MTRNLLTCLLCGALAGPFAVTAVPAAESFSDALFKGRPFINARYRYERVDQDGFREDAHASTLRTRVGYETQKFKGLNVLLELENISAIGDDKFNDTVNRRTQFPIVADPDITELNQGYLNYDSDFDTALRIGRQRIKLDNERFVGAVGFRQNEQTFDAVGVTNRSLDDTTLRYIYVGNVNRIFGDDSRGGDFESNSHLINMKFDDLPFGTLVGYSYILDLEDAPAFSSQTYGARISGRRDFNFNHDLSLLYAAEFAYQRQHAGNPGDFDVNYYLVEPGFRLRDMTFKLGYEVLDGDGTNAFQTPLATLHAFNGVTDQLLVTPAGGIEDIYTKFRYTLDSIDPFEGLSISAAYHLFLSEDTSATIGTEWSAKLVLKLTRNVAVSIEHAEYDARSESVDTQKTWVTLQLVF